MKQVQVKILNPKIGNDDKYDESGVAGGVGLGYNLSPNASVEAEYTRLPSVDVTNNVSVDTDLVTVGAHYKF